ncbi:MAG: peptidoglycan DD-metalloendopeptidase family protein [Desulfobacterales bacterium]|nr:peptidoglycan DD-metalloendopeptidase family protein [Desulfobacterales bacterium]
MKVYTRYFIMPLIIFFFPFANVFCNDISNIQKQIDEKKAKINEIDKAEIAIIRELEEIDFFLNRATQKLSLIKSELVSINEKTNKTQVEYEKILYKINSQKDYISKRIVAIYKLGLLGEMATVASSRSIGDFLFNSRSLEYIVYYDLSALETYGHYLKELKSTQVMLEIQKNEKSALENDYRDQIETISIERLKRNSLLSDIRTKKSLLIAAIESLKKASSELDKKVSSLPNIDSAFPNKGDKKNFSSHKGLLNMPIKGKIVSVFGSHINTEFNIETFRSGIDIKAERGDPVKAVFEGNILFANWFKGYGNMMIIDHGDNYYSVYAHAEELFKKTGDFVEADEVIANVGDFGSFGDATLYFEIRHHGKPLDPIKWLNLN